MPRAFLSFDGGQPHRFILNLGRAVALSLGWLIHSPFLASKVRSLINPEPAGVQPRPAATRVVQELGAAYYGRRLEVQYKSQESRVKKDV